VFNVEIVNAGSPCFLRAGAYGFWRAFLAVDAGKFSTREEELPVPQARLRKMYVLRRILNPMGPLDGIEFLLG
jgi:transcription termination factor Rho